MVFNEEVVKTTISLPKSLDTEVRVQAARDRTSISAIAAEALRQYLQTRQPVEAS